MACGGLCVMTPLIKPMPMWHVNSWDMAQLTIMEMLVHWGECKIVTLKFKFCRMITVYIASVMNLKILTNLHH